MIYRTSRCDRAGILVRSEVNDTLFRFLIDLYDHTAQL